MRKDYLAAVLTFSFILYLSIAAPIFADAEATSAQSPKDAPHSFSDIRLSPEGVQAMDSLGNRWYYNFDSGQFLPYDEGNLPDEFGTPAQLPIEERAIEEKIVEPLEQSVTIGPDEYVDGDIIAYGRITIRGWVKGNVQSATSRVLVMEGGQVDGDITAPEILIKPGGVVMGRVNETGVSLNLKDIREAFDFSGIIVVVAFTISLMLACFVITTLMPRQVNVIERCIRTYKLRCFSLGFLSIFLIPIAILLLIITIVGILAIPVVPLLIIFIFFTTFAGYSRMLGERVLKLIFPSRTAGTHLATQLGIVMFMSLWLVTAILLGSDDSVSTGFGTFLLVMSILTYSYILLSGLGAAILTRVGTREYLGWHERHVRATESQAPMPAPPPIPDMPPQPPSPDSDRGGNSPIL